VSDRVTYLWWRQRRFFRQPLPGVVFFHFQNYCPKQQNVAIVVSAFVELKYIKQKHSLMKKNRDWIGINNNQ